MTPLAPKGLRRKLGLVGPGIAMGATLLSCSKRITNAFRNKVMGNIVFGGSVLPLVAIAVEEIRGLF